MKKTVLGVMVTAVIVAVLCVGIMLRLGGVAMSESIHYYKGANIGDVHPYWHAESETWYMYYLKSDGTFSSALLRSKDMLNWEPVEITGQGVMAAYYVLGVQQAQDGKFYSWYGSDISMTASTSQDLIHWNTPGPEYNIPMGYTMFVSMRDPYVFFDEDAGVWRMICTAYRSNQLSGKGLGMKCALATAVSEGETPTNWNAVDTALIEYPKGLEGEPECPQMMKIGNRWYIFVSLARRHENHVGRLSYYIGDEGKGILEQDWNAKEEHFLTGEDLCAAQLVEGPDGIYLWGWIAPNWNGGDWGGHLSLPLKVTQNADGTLAAMLPDQMGDAIRGDLIASGTDAVKGNFTRWDAQINFSIDTGDRAEIICANGKIIIDDAQGRFSVAQNDELTHVSYAVEPGTLVGEHEVRIIADENMLEVFMDGQWALSARMQQDVKCRSISVENAANVSLEVYTIK